MTTKDKLIMRLLLEGIEIQKLEASLSPSLAVLTNRSIVGFPVIKGEYPINREAIRDAHTAYLTFENIRGNYPDKEVKIEISYI